MTGELPHRHIPLTADDGHAWDLLHIQARSPATPRARLLWLPAMGVSARHYLPFAQALAARGIDVALHEWRGHGSSNLRAARNVDWGYAQLLQTDIPCSLRALKAASPDLNTIIGGHSLGGQLSCCLLALQPGAAQHLWLVACGSPWPGAFPAPFRWGLQAAFALALWVPGIRGYWNGRRIGFGGREARTVMRDWADTGISGRYRIGSLGRDLDPELRAVKAAVTPVVMANDTWAPVSSMRELLRKIGREHHHIRTMATSSLGTAAGHFSWMRHDNGVTAVAEVLAGSMDGAACDNEESLPP